MTSANPRQQQALSAALSRAVDLSALKSPKPASVTGVPAGGPPVSSQYILEVTEETFGPEVIDRSGQVLVIVDLWATWCEPCKQLSPLLERLVAEYNGAVYLATVDVDANPRIAQAFQVQSIPTVVAVAAGQPVDAFSGAQAEPQLRAWLTSLVDALRPRLPGIAAAEAAAGSAVVEAPVDPRLLAAEDAIEAGDYDVAMGIYEQIVAAEPANTEAALALAQLKFQQHVESLPADAVAIAAAAPDDVSGQFDAADLEFALGQVPAAFGRLVSLVSRSAGEDKTAARHHLLELFALLGNDDPDVITARRALAAALY